jgi:hypothetical protein
VVVRVGLAGVAGGENLPVRADDHGTTENGRFVRAKAVLDIVDTQKNRPDLIAVRYSIDGVVTQQTIVIPHAADEELPMAVPDQASLHTIGVELPRRRRTAGLGLCCGCRR